MNNVHGCWEWRLAPGSALRVPAAARPRWLAVTQGRVWITRSGAGPQGGDVWLQAGQRHPLPAGSEWVAEGWPEARIELLEAAPVSVRASRAASWRGWFGAPQAAPAA